MVSRARLLPVAVVLGVLASGARADEPLRFVKPEAGSVLAGATSVVFEVEPTEPPVTRVDLYAQGKLVGTAYAPEWTLTWEAEAGKKQFELSAVAYSQQTVAGRATRTFKGTEFHQYESVDLVQLYPVVTTPTGQYEENLGRDDFAIYEDGVEMTITNFATKAESLSIVLLIDASDSMAGKLGQVQVAASNFVDELGELDRVGLYAFDHATRKLSDLVFDHELVKDRLWDLAPGGGTAMYDAVTRVIRDNLSRIPGRKALFIFSDGIDRHSITSLAQAVRAANEDNVIVYAVGSGEDEDSLRARKDLTALADRSGGKSYFIFRARQLEGVFASILEELRSQYVLSYRPPPGPEGIREITIEVVGGAHGRARQERIAKVAQDQDRLPGYEIRYRRSYYYTPPEE